MSATPRDAATDLKPNELRLDRLVGRRVFARNNESIGRLEEIRADRHGTGCVIAEYVIGVAGLLERLGVGLRLLVGRHSARGYLARWDQLDLSDPHRPRLRCSRDDLRKL